MNLIAHRGNLNGPNPEQENNPEYLAIAIEQGYDVEVDVWYKNHKLFLGHDFPAYETSLEFLKKDFIWAHAKNLEALHYLLENDVHCFWHEEDQHTLTSRGYIWTYPNMLVTSKSVIVDLEPQVKLRPCYGICFDWTPIQK